MSNKYVQSKEESIALLKLVIAEMSQHDAPFDPASFAVWYEHLAGINPGLSEALKQARQIQPRLDAETVARLHRDHVAEIDETAAETARGEFRRVMRGVAESAAHTGSQARAYGSQLAGLSQALQAGDSAVDTAALTPHLHTVADGTAHMEAVVSDLANAVAAGEHEIDRLHQALERSRVEALTDALSGLRNRKGFDQALREVIATPPPTGLAHCLVVLDIDHFKRVNDTHGHPVGDTVIETVGKVLARVASSPNLVAARIGGEEFALILRASTAAQALKTAETVRSLVSAVKIRKRGSQDVIDRITISAGVATWVPGDDPRGLLAVADAALYRSKANGRDRVTVA